MAVNPVRPVALLKELRDLFVDFVDDDEPEESLVVKFFQKLLLVDGLVGDTRARDKLQEALAKARDEGRDDDVRAMEQVLG